MPDDPKSDPPDFELRKYELDRAHELELNKFAHGLEVERLKILQLVNGGAFTVLVAFAPGLLRVGGVAEVFALGAAICWVFGLGAAAWATQIQVKAQAKFNQSVRFRRNAIEWRRLNKPHDQLVRMVGPPPPGKRPTGDESYDRFARRAHRAGAGVSRWLELCAMTGVLLFILGALLLTVSVSRADPAALVPAEKASR